MASSLERGVQGLVGAAFVLRVFDGRKPWLVRLGYGLVGYDLLSAAWTDKSIFSGGQNSGLVRGGRTRALTAGSPSVPLTFAEVKVNSIEERVAKVHEQLLRGTRDPKIYALAREVLTRKCGSEWCVPEKDGPAEISALFAEARSRVRYTWDPLDYDAFQTPAKTLALRSGDCDDIVALLGALLRSVGYKVRSRVVRTTSNATWNHIYLLVQIPTTKQWVPLDLTVAQPPGWEVPANLVQEVRDFDVMEKGAAARALTQPTPTGVLA